MKSRRPTKSGARSCPKSNSRFCARKTPSARSTSAFNDEKRTGNFHCAGCDLPVYGSYAKYDSGTGWPSFYESLKDAIGTKEDNSLFATRTEIHCRRCGGHFGHVFDDGPKPTGMRHCLNGVALTFKPRRLRQVAMAKCQSP